MKRSGRQAAGVPTPAASGQERRRPEGLPAFLRAIGWLACALAVAGCAMPGDAAPIIKIGVIAPFEGLGRPLGYALLPAVKQAVLEANAGGTLGAYRVTVVALNDDDNARSAADQAVALARDPDVMAVLGPWSMDTVAAAVPALQAAELPALVAAPGAGLPPGMRSLCPSPEDVAQQWASEVQRQGGGQVGLAGPQNALEKAARSALARLASGQNGLDVRLFTGNAADAADAVVMWRQAGWQGRLLVGPDAARSWFIGRAGAASEATRAIACGPGEAPPPSFGAAYQAQTGAAPGPEAELAYQGTRALLTALARGMKAEGRPSRTGTARALAGLPLTLKPLWLEMRNGSWQVSSTPSS